jgi:multidrug efflux pump subunit AcrA (membrane-fusion protein)
MLKISSQPIGEIIDRTKHKAFKIIGEAPGKKIARVLQVAFIVSIGMMFLPWTQNIRANGFLTALQPDKRPQSLHSIIAGRIEKWYVQEGDFVYRGDTILHISEIKEEYFDTLLVQRTQGQVSAKAEAIASYKQKAEALERQINALDETRKNKLEQANNLLFQARLKVQTDSIEIDAAYTRLQVARDQFDRVKTLYTQGLVPLNEFEARNMRFQEAQARMVAAENNLLTSRNSVINAEVQLFTLENEFQEKIAKARSDLYSALTNQFQAEGDLQKLQNMLSNYAFRAGLYWVLAPQDGYITRANKTGIGMLIKEGEEIVSIMPGNIELAVEMYIRPIDLPLIRPGNTVRFLFDGWPAVVFSGWPNLSFGTFGGRVAVIDNFANAEGLYRMLVVPDPNDIPWPEALRVGSGAQGIALLKDVPIWYEVWRQLNGFPPDYYIQSSYTKNGK